MTRDEHLAQAKERALAELTAPGIEGVRNALASMFSDLRKHEAFRNEATDRLNVLGLKLVMIAAMKGEAAMREETRRWIEGYQ